MKININVRGTKLGIGIPAGIGGIGIGCGIIICLYFGKDERNSSYIIITYLDLLHNVLCLSSILNLLMKYLRQDE